jgi:hypothetical protein
MIHSPVNNSRVYEFAESNPKNINPNGVFRSMCDFQDFPLTDGDISRLANSFGLGTGTMKVFIRNNGLDARLEEYYMGNLDKDKAMELYNLGMTDQSIGERCGVSPMAIYNWRKKNGLKANGKSMPMKVVGTTVSDGVKVYQPKDQIKTDPPDCASSVQPDRGLNGKFVGWDEAGYWEPIELRIGVEQVEAVNIIADAAEHMTLTEIPLEKRTLPEGWQDYFAADKQTIAKLNRIITFLRGIAIGAGVLDIDALIKELSLEV